MPQQRVKIWHSQINTYILKKKKKKKNEHPRKHFEGHAAH